MDKLNEPNVFNEFIRFCKPLDINLHTQMFIYEVPIKITDRPELNVQLIYSVPFRQYAISVIEYHCLWTSTNFSPDEFSIPELKHLIKQGVEALA